MRTLREQIAAIFGKSSAKKSRSQILDPRALSLEKIVPPSPLPYVSRRALKLVSDGAPPPTECRYCSGDVELVINSEVYNGRVYGEWPYCYLCRSCDAYVGLHPNTDLPLGILANKELRKSRRVSKWLFIEITKNKGWSRNQAYHWLSKKMQIKPSRCHWGMFDINECEMAGMICANEFEAAGEFDSRKPEGSDYD